MPQETADKANAIANGQGGHQPSEQPNQNTAPASDPSNTGAPTGQTPEQVAKAIEAARKQEKDKLYGTIQKLEADAKKHAESAAALQARLDEMDRNRQQELTPDQRMQEQVSGLQQQLEAEKQARLQFEQMANQQRAEAELERYRQRRLQEEGPTLVPELVFGRSEGDIEASIAMAKAAYADMRQRVEAEISAKYPQPGVPPANVPGVPQHPNPHWAGAAGFPSPVTPPPAPTQPELDQAQFRAMCDPEAVRNGTYRQHRDEMLRQLRERNPAGFAEGTNLGITPRYVPQGYQAPPVPNGQPAPVAVPPNQGTQQFAPPNPGAPFAPPKVYVPSHGPGYPQPPAQPTTAPASGNPSADARAAIERARHGIPAPTP